MYRTVFELIRKNASRTRDRLIKLVIVGSRILEQCFKRDVGIGSNVDSTYSSTELIIFNEHMIGKLSVGEIGKEITVGDHELADVMTRSRV